MKTNTDRTEVVTEHAHTHRNASDTLTRFVVQREIVCSGRFGFCWLVHQKGRPSSALSGMKRAAASFATAASTRTRVCENEMPTCAAKESGDGSANSWDDGCERREFVEAELASIQRKRTKSSASLPYVSAVRNKEA